MLRLMAIPRAYRLFASRLLVLSSALTCAFTTFAIADAAWLHPFLFKDPGHLAVPALLSSRSRQALADVPAEFVGPWRALLGADAITAYRREWTPVDLGAGPRDSWIVRTSPGVMALTGLTPELGRDFAADEARKPVAILPHTMWRSAFASDRTVIGRWVTAAGSAVQIVGVAPPTLVLPGMPSPTLLLPLSPVSGIATAADASPTRVLVRSSLPSGALRERLQTAVADQLLSISTPTTGDIRIDVSGLSAAAGQVGATGPVFLVMAGCILIIAILSILHLEIANFAVAGPAAIIHLALGARERIIPLHICRRLALVVTASTVMALLASRTVLQLLGPDLHQSLRLARLPSLTTATTVPILLITVATLALASVTLSVQLVRLIRNGTFSLNCARPINVFRRATRLAIVGLQLACCGALVVLAAASGSLFLILVTTDLGINTTKVLAVNINANGATPAAVDTIARGFKDELLALPTVISVAYVDILPFGGAFPWTEAVAVGSAQAERTKVRLVDESYFASLDLRIAEGRAFAAFDMVSPPTVAIVNKSFQRRHFPFGSGDQFITMGGNNSLRIVGVAVDARDEDLVRPARPTVYLPFSDRAFKRYHAKGVLIRVSVDDQRTFASVEAVVRRLPVRSSRLVRLEERFGNALAAPGAYASLTAAFGLLSITLAVFGTFSVASAVVMQRTHEIAVRTVCGARRRDIVVMFGKEIAAVICLGLCLGAAVGVPLARLLAEAAFRDVPFRPWVIGAGICVTGLSAAVATIVPAFRAASRNPAAVLRSS